MTLNPTRRTTPHLLAAVAMSSPAVAAQTPSVREIQSLVADGRLGQAMEKVDAVLLRHPDSAKAHYIKSQIHFKMGDWKSAKNELDAASKIDPFGKFGTTEGLRDYTDNLNMKLSQPMPPTVSQTVQQDPPARQQTTDVGFGGLEAFLVLPVALLVALILLKIIAGRREAIAEEAAMLGLSDQSGKALPSPKASAEQARRLRAVAESSLALSAESSGERGEKLYSMGKRAYETMEMARLGTLSGVELARTRRGIEDEARKIGIHINQGTK